MTEYLFKSEAIFIFITYILGRDSPYFEETKLKGDNWDLGRSNIDGVENIIQLIYTLFKQSDKYVLTNEKSPQQVNIYLILDCTIVRKRF